ncbi:MAG: glycosyltransferase family 61 protein [Candidatus Dependentiae bacterium]|nr:glycosyltransferase family 61 protein [Candidatus Dependentiae bacterium]
MSQKNYTKILLIFLTSFSHLKINCWWFDILPIKQIIQENPSIKYTKCFDPVDFNYAEFPLSLNQSWHPNKGRFDETFVITIPNGTLQSKNGFTVINNHFIDEMIWKKFMHNLQLVKQYNYKPQYFAKRVAVITQPAYGNYFHWLTEVLCRLALLEISGEPYDYIYTPQDRAYIKGSLDLWGIPQEKILTPSNDDTYLQAKEIIIPSLVSNSSLNSIYFSCYVQPHLIKYVINKLLAAAKEFPSEHEKSKRIFISRKDSPQRKLLNEDDVFALLKPHGFVRYELEHLSVTQQILLFHNAEIVISPQGTGLANCIFCTPKTQIIELFQGLNDCTFWYLSQELGLNYTPIKTIEFSPNYYSGWSDNTSMPLDIIQKMIGDLNID